MHACADVASSASAALCVVALPAPCCFVHRPFLPPRSRFVATQGTPIALRMPMHRLNLNPVLIAALVIVPVVGLAAWAWLARARVEADLRSFAGFEGMHFES